MHAGFQFVVVTQTGCNTYPFNCSSQKGYKCISEVLYLMSCHKNISSLGTIKAELSRNLKPAYIRWEKGCVASHLITTFYFKRN